MSFQLRDAAKKMEALEASRPGEEEAPGAAQAAMATPAPSRREKRVFRILPWLVGLMAIAAVGTGIDAIWNAEYCARGRTSVSCTHGFKAQMEGAVAVATGLLMAMVPVRPFAGKRVVACLMAVLAYGLLIASLLS